MSSIAPKISIIIPVYNSQKYLNQCLDSIINQTFNDFEVICIDDQSTDSSLDILQNYAKIDPRIKIIRQENAGAGAARNAGLKIAKGDYILFLDSDDFFELNMLEKAYEACVKNDLDFVVFRSDIYDDKANKFILQYFTVRSDLLPKKRIFCYKDIKKDLFRVFVGWAWDKLYKREFVLSNNFFFQEQRSTNDLFFVFTAFIKAKRIMVINDILVHHRTNIGSSLSTTREKSWQCFYNALLALKEELIKSGIYEEIEQSYINYALHFSLWNLNTIEGPAFKELYNSLRTEIFNELGIIKYNKSYFWNKREYKQFQHIMANKNITNESYCANHKKPNLIKAFIQSLLSNGLKHVLHKIKYAILRK